MLPSRRFLTGVLLALCAPVSVLADAPLQLSPTLATGTVTQDVPLPGLPDSSQVLRLSVDPAHEVRDELPPIPTIDLTASPDDLWQRLRTGFAMPDLESPLVAQHQAWYLNRPDALKRIFDRSRRYLFHIVEELQKRGMPTELALLPVIESSYNPLAYSPARAHGMWQFIPSTGKNYKLQQNWWLDQRRDIVASTNAALDYLQTIYDMHGDWQLALASYNWGEGAVGRAVAKNRAQGLPSDYTSLRMPEETRHYVPKLQAIKNIVATPELFGIQLPAIRNEAHFGTVAVDSDIDVALAARLAEIPVDEFIALNPAYSRPVIPETAGSPLVLPADKVQTFLNNLERHEQQDKPLSSWLTHTLKKGEKLDAVAARHGIDGTRLRALNGITKRTKVGPGMTLLVPNRSAKPEIFLTSLPQTPATPPKAAKSPKSKKATKGKSAKAKPVTGAKARKPAAKAAPGKSAKRR